MISIIRDTVTKALTVVAVAYGLAAYMYLTEALVSVVTR